MRIIASAIHQRLAMLTLCAGVAAVACGFSVAASAAENTPRKIILIGGVKSEGGARHDYPNGVRVLQNLLNASPDIGANNLAVEAWPEGWPADSAAFDNAATVVLYFDGLDKHPLLDDGRRAQFETLMQRGVGLVALHQASTVPADGDRIGLQRWLGGVRVGMVDRTDELAALQPASTAHPVNRGAGRFSYFDEFYPTISFLKNARGITPILRGNLHVQARDNKPVMIGNAKSYTIAWAFERPAGGRSFGFTGGHYPGALDMPAVQKMLLNAISWTAGLDIPKQGVRLGAMQVAATKSASARDTSSATTVSLLDVTTFHRNPQRTGWNPRERELTPAAIASGNFGAVWSTPPFDSSGEHPARLYASPLYLDNVPITAGTFRGGNFSAVFAATSNGDVYAVNAVTQGSTRAGTILWRTHLAEPCLMQPVLLDGVATGVLATPVIDVRRQRLYVTSCDPEKRWQAYALDVGSGAIVAGWPVALDENDFNAANKNPGTGKAIAPRRFDYRLQRGALNLSPDGAHLYVTFGESATGWLVAVDTASAKISSAFATVADPYRSSGGIWGAGGPAVASDGAVFVATGTGFNGYVDDPGNWAQSVLKLEHVRGNGFALTGTYTPFNYCDTATADIDLGSGGVLLLPELGAGATATPQLLALGGKQGNVYLLDRARLPGRMDRRQPCSTDAASDRSLLAPAAQTQFGSRGPLNVFGPYSEKEAAIDTARSRSVPAYFRDDRADAFLFVTGTTRAEPPGPPGPAAVPPSLVKLKVVAAGGKPAYLVIDQAEQTLVFENPGSPVISSNGSRDAIAWVLDSNARRSAPLTGTGAPQPVLYAVDALTLKPLWRSRPGELSASGKYNEPLVVRGTVIVGTDRLQAFGLRRAGVVSAGATPSSGDGQVLYAQRCAGCHDEPDGRIPPRTFIAAKPRAVVIDALTAGAMRIQATGLSVAQIESLATYLGQQNHE